MEKQSRREKHHRSQAKKNKNKPHQYREKNKEDEKSHSSKSDVASTNEISNHNLEDATSTSDEFNKRKLESNWDRYEESGEERILGDHLRGADFSDLLEAGIGGSAFRFKEEQIWSEELRTAPKANEFFSIDVDDLNAAILCIPLHRRLLIDSAAFPRKMLGKLERIANESYVEYMQGKRSRPVAKTQEIIKEMFLECKEKAVKDSEKETVENVKAGNETEKIEVSNTAEKNELEVSILEKELDNLLVDKNEGKKTESKENVSSVVSTTTTTTTTTQIQLFSDSKAENLEDWLDTILDD